MRYDALDSWRGICATMVMVYHFAIASHFYNVDLVRNAFLFVDFFFVLSGFVIAINYQERLMSGFGVGRFMALRLGRVWPLHAFILLAFILLEVVLVAWPALQQATCLAPGETGGCHVPFTGEDRSFTAIITNLFLVHSLPGVHENVTWNGPSWSISVEFYTYLIFAVGLWVVSRLPKRNTLLVLGLVAIMIVAPLIIYKFGGRQNIFLTTGGGLIRCVYGFAAGVLASMIFTQWKEPILSLFRNRTVATVIEVGVLAVVIAFASLVGFSSFNLTAPLFFLVVILAFAPQAGAISWVLTRRPLLYLGALSYSIYMTHYIVQAVIYHMWNMTKASGGGELFDRLDGYEVAAALVPTERMWTGDLWVIGGSIVVIGVSALTYEFVEKPGREWMRKRVSRKKQKPATLAPTQTPSV